MNPTTNKHTREIAKAKRLAARARDMGITTPFVDLPKETRIALSTTGFDSHRSVAKYRDRKAFSRDKRSYGHFSGHSGGSLPGGKRALVERAIINSHRTDASASD